MDSNQGDSDGFSAIRSLFNEWYPLDTSKKARISLKQRGTCTAHYIREDVLRELVLERLRLEMESLADWIDTQEEDNNGLDAFVALTRKYVDVTGLTPTIVNAYIKKIVVFAPDRSSGKRKQKIKCFNFADEVDIPVLPEPMIAERTHKSRKTV